METTDIVALVSADSDLVPPIELIQRRFPEIGIKVYFPPSNFSNDLKDNLIHHRSKPVLMIKNIRRFQSAVMPDIISKDGKTYTIPEKWKQEYGSKAIKFFEANESESPSRFVEEAAWREENANWLLRLSRQLAVTLIGYMQDNGMKRADLASKLGVSPQYVSKLLSGTENLSFKSIANIEDRLGISCLVMVNA